MTVLERTFYGNTLEAWLVAAAFFAGVLVALWLVDRIVTSRLTKLAKRTRTGLDDLVAHVLGTTKVLLFLFLALYFASLRLSLSAGTRTVLDRVVVIALLLQVGVWASAALRFWVESYCDRMLAEDAASATTVSALSFVGRLVLWVVVGLLVLDNLQVDITALVTGLGIGGIAVALAVQNVLGDLFASLSIVLDKPFVIGDFLDVDGMVGKVEHIGLKTTRVRSLSGEQLVFSNADLLKSRIRNFGRMFERRASFTIGVTYGTPREKLEEIPRMIREIVENRELTRFDRSHFKEYGDSALLFETVYYVTTPEYGTYMEIQQGINLELYRRFEEERIEFAYPTRTILLKPEGARTAGNR
ncbi:MAG: mechanosensitive ion channel family protein [Gemmatimonadota bacterium]